MTPKQKAEAIKRMVAERLKVLCGFDLSNEEVDEISNLPLAQYYLRLDELRNLHSKKVENV